jgi:hypothetical protein
MIERTLSSLSFWSKNIKILNGLLILVIEHVAFNNVVVGLIPTDDVLHFLLFLLSKII